jgi:hypothetical protein
LSATAPTRALLISSAAVLGLLGVSATFLPAEIVRAMGSEPTTQLEIVIQIIGALYLGFATLNWFARESLVGGIYSRPLVVGNFAHFMIAGIALLKAVSGPSAGPIMWTLAVIYVVFAACFGYLMFRHPLSSPSPNP